MEDANYDECVRRARALADENGGVLLQDTTLDNYEALPHEIMRGYAAIAVEVFEEMPEPPTHIILQAGVGAFAGAMASAFTELWPGADICFIVCEAAAAPCLMLSAAAGERRIVTGALGTIMAGLACGEPCDIGLASLLSRARIFAALPDACAAEAMRVLAAGGRRRRGIRRGGHGPAARGDAPSRLSRGCARRRGLMNTAACSCSTPRRRRTRKIIAPSWEPRLDRQRLLEYDKQEVIFYGQQQPQKEQPGGQ